MYCKNCGNKLDNNVNFCPRCGTKNEIQAKEQRQSISKKFFSTSTISLLIFILIILTNVIVYPLSLSDDMTSGMSWFFIVLLPSIPLFILSYVLCIVSISNFIKNKKNNINIPIFKITFTILNIIQLIIMSIIIIWIIVWWNGIV